MNQPSMPRNANFRTVEILCGCFFTLFFFYPVVPAAARGRQSEEADTAMIRGVVVNSVTHSAVPHALVFSSDNRFAKLTDGEGRFAFKVPQTPPVQAPGTPMSGGLSTARRHLGATIIFLARKPGYFQSSGAAWSPEEEESKSEMRIALVPEAYITGRVNLPANDGAEQIRVAIYRRDVQDGRGHWVQAETVNARANGEFRFANLRDGDYRLFTEELLDRDPVAFNPRGPAWGYPPSYFPSAADFESAGLIHLKAGEVFSATLTPLRREYFPVRLPVLNISAGVGLQISVAPQAHHGPGYSLGFNSNDSTIQGLLPNGNYTVEVASYGEGSSGTGAVNFSVSGSPVQGPAVTLVPNSSIEVTVKDDRTKADNALAQGAQNLLNGFQVRMSALDEFAQVNQVWLRGPGNAQDESVHFVDARPGSYRLETGCNPTGYVAAITSGGRDVLQQPVIIGAGAAMPPFEVTIRDDGAQLQGHIENWAASRRRPAANGFVADPPVVVLVPLPDSSGAYCQAWPDGNGAFTFGQVPPGAYRAIAFEHQPADLAYKDPQAMEKFEGQGQLVRLVAGQKEQVRLTIAKESE